MQRHRDDGKCTLHSKPDIGPPLGPYVHPKGGQMTTMITFGQKLQRTLEMHVIGDIQEQHADVPLEE